MTGEFAVYWKPLTMATPGTARGHRGEPHGPGPKRRYKADASPCGSNSSFSGNHIIGFCAVSKNPQWPAHLQNLPYSAMLSTSTPQTKTAATCICLISMVGPKGLGCIRQCSCLQASRSDLRTFTFKRPSNRSLQP